jgi:hypothetical protein
MFDQITVPDPAWLAVLSTIAISDPNCDGAEDGEPGWVWDGDLIEHPHGAHAPDVHNDAGNVSRECYWVNPSPYPENGLWMLKDYPGGFSTIVEAAVIICPKSVAIELLNFDATAGDGQVILTWQTASEVNAHSFNVYRDGEIITSVPAFGDTHPYCYVDRTVTNGITYTYQLGDVDLDGTETMYETVCEVTPMAVPTEFALSQNYPNPFNAVTDIRYALPVKARVNLKIYNLLGQEVITLVDGERGPGHHTVEWDGHDSNTLEVASGIYFYRLKTEDFSATRKMVLIK